MKTTVDSSIDDNIPVSAPERARGDSNTQPADSLSVVYMTRTDAPCRVFVELTAGVPALRKRADRRFRALPGLLTTSVSHIVKSELISGGVNEDSR